MIRLPEEDYAYVEARYRELLERIESLRTQISILRAEISSMEGALKRLEELDGVEVVYERAGHVFIPRSREDALSDLKDNLQAMRGFLERLEREDKEVRAELSRLVESLKSRLSTSPAGAG